MFIIFPAFLDLSSSWHHGVCVHAVLFSTGSLFCIYALNVILFFAIRFLNIFALWSQTWQVYALLSIWSFRLTKPSKLSFSIQLLLI